MARVCWFLILVFSLAAAAAEEVPIRLGRGMVFVDVRIGGESRNFLLDSGAEETVLSRGLAKDLGLRTVSREQVRLTSGLGSVDRSEAFSLALGRTSFRSKGALCLDLRRESRHLGQKIDGLLGMDFLKGRVLRIDFGRQRLDLGSGGKRSADSSVLRIRWNHGVPCVPVTVGSERLEMVRIDTGCDQALSWVDTGMGGFRFGAYRNRQVDLQLGDWAIPDVKTRCYRQAIFPGERGLLGMKSLSRCRAVVLDFSRDRLILER